MAKSDHDFFNCSEAHEHDYVARLYEKQQEVKEELKKICTEKGSKNLTHKDLYEMLAKRGYTRK